MKAVLPALARPLLETRLPADLDVVWFADREEAARMVVDADIAWIDLQPPAHTGVTAMKGDRLKWLFTLYAGLDSFPLAALKAKGVTITNGAGISAYAVAEYAVMGMLVAAKRFDEVVRFADRRHWPTEAPGTVELFETAALIIGYGTIGRLIGERLAAFGVEVSGVTRSGRDNTLKPDQWRRELGDYDWVVLAAPSTDETRAMIGADELAAMKSSAWLVNVARGDMVDKHALIEALEARRIGGAFLDTVDPEPLPDDDHLWRTPNTIHSMHLSGRSQSRIFERAASLFLANLAAFRAGGQMRNVVDPDAGY